MTAPKRILVVDDDVDLLEQTEIVLHGEGYEVVTAVGREDAEEKLLGVRPDLCVVDLMMETMDAGFALCADVKRLYPGVPVILLTAVRSSTGLDLAAGAADGGAWIKADGFLDKPVRPEQLRAEVSRLLAAAR